MNFYLNKNSQKLGPYSVDQIQIFLKQGLVTTTDQVWCEGWPSWMAIGNVPGLAPNQSSEQSSNPVHHAQTQGATFSQPASKGQSSVGRYAEGKNPVKACVLSLFIVGTGQFYNGDWTKGWVMLITCIMATIFSFGTLWLFWALFSAVDAYRVADKKKPLEAYFIPF